MVADLPALRVHVRTSIYAFNKAKFRGFVTLGPVRIAATATVGELKARIERLLPNGFVQCPAGRQRLAWRNPEEGVAHEAEASSCSQT